MFGYLPSPGAQLLWQMSKGHFGGRIGAILIAHTCRNISRAFLKGALPPHQLIGSGSVNLIRFRNRMKDYNFSVW